MPNTATKTNPQRKKRTVRSAATWRHHIEQWKHSKLSQSEYCQQHDLALGTFGGWKTKLDRTDHNKNEDPLPQFVPVKIKSNPEVAPLTMEIRFAGNVSIQIPSDSNPNIVLPWINVLRSQS